MRWEVEIGWSGLWGGIGEIAIVPSAELENGVVCIFFFFLFLPLSPGKLRDSPRG